MVTNSISENHGEESFEIKDDRIFSRSMSKERSSMANPSFRVYYGVAAAGAVPFLWESRPGTPKHIDDVATVPPLTPPPSYYFRSPKNVKESSSYKATLVAGIIRPKPHAGSAPPCNSSLSSSFSSSSSSCSYFSFSPAGGKRQHSHSNPNTLSSLISSDREYDSDSDSDDSDPPSKFTLCFKIVPRRR